MNQPLELIVISKGLSLRYNALWWRRNSDSRSKKTMGEREEYYNVMWIEWKDRIAYRKGVGRVSKGDWEAQDTEWIDLILG